MKTTLKNFTLAFALIAGLSLSAADVNVAVKEGFTLEISLEQIGQASTVLLQDAEGFTLYSRQLSNTAETLDLKNLPNGTYTLLMENEMIHKKSVIVKEAGGLSIVEDTEGTIFKPSFKKEGKMLRMLLANPTQGTVYFKVYDAQGEQVAAVQGYGALIKKSFDFSNVRGGNYTVETYVGKQYFSKAISIN